MRERKPFKKIEWSKRSMVHNLFRLFEFAFGRKKGVRIENRTIQSGEFVYREFYTIEAQMAFWEAEFYELLAKPIKKLEQLKTIQVYQPVPVYGAINPIGYRFAIAEDATTTENANDVTSPDTTTSHTTSGSDRGLLFGANWGWTSDTGDFSAVTYNSVSLSAEVSRADYNRRSTFWSLIAPSTGSNTGQTTWSGTASDKVYIFTTLTGVDQTDMVEATNSAQATYPTTTPSISITTLTDDAWAIGQFVNRENNTVTITTGTEIYNVLGGGTGVGCAGGYSTGTAGSKTVAWSTGGTEYGTMTIVSVKPAGGSSASSSPSSSPSPSVSSSPSSSPSSSVSSSPSSSPSPSVSSSPSSSVSSSPSSSPSPSVSSSPSPSESASPSASPSTSPSSSPSAGASPSSSPSPSPSSSPSPSVSSSPSPSVSSSPSPSVSSSPSSSPSASVSSSPSTSPSASPSPQVWTPVSRSSDPTWTPISRQGT